MTLASRKLFKRLLPPNEWIRRSKSKQISTKLALKPKRCTTTSSFELNRQLSTRSTTLLHVFTSILVVLQIKLSFFLHIFRKEQIFLNFFFVNLRLNDFFSNLNSVLCWNLELLVQKVMFKLWFHFSLNHTLRNVIHLKKMFHCKSTFFSKKFKKKNSNNEINYSCTLKSFPSKLEHTTEWARDFSFGGQFVTSPETLNRLAQEPNLLPRLDQPGAGGFVFLCFMFSKKKSNQFSKKKTNYVLLLTVNII